MIGVDRVELGVTDCPSRLPFRFGAATVTFAPLLTARVTLAGGAVGHAADLMMPRWFDKTPGRTIADDVGALAASARRAAAAFVDQPRGTAFASWLGAYRRCLAEGSVPLVDGFGAALVERATLDALCRSEGVSFFEAWQRDLFGFTPGALDPALEGWSLERALPASLAPTIGVRHTIGMLDPLWRDEIDPARRVDDGFPQALEEDIARYGLRAFKVKVGGDPAADTARLARLAEALPELAGADFVVTLDGNEQYTEPAALAGVLERLQGLPGGAGFVERVLWIEQPLPRAASFDPAHAAGIARLGTFAPVIVDEADAGEGAFRAALATGHDGISMKNCKGVFRAFVHRALCDVVGEGRFLAGEDLTNLPVLSLQQDLMTALVLGLEHVERNGHHYFRGLDHLPATEARAALEAHPALYRATEDGGVALQIAGGALDVSSLDVPGYSHDGAVDFEARTPLDDWSLPEGLA